MRWYENLQEILKNDEGENILNKKGKKKEKNKEPSETKDYPQKQKMLYGPHHGSIF